MSWIVPWFLLAVSPAISDTEVWMQADKEAEAFLKGLYDTAHSDTALKCKKCTSPIAISKASSEKLLIFMSFSIPLESWKEWSLSLEKAGGAFVLKGLPGNSFQIFAKKALELKNAGVNVPIYIDPDAYEKYEITSVPTVIRMHDEGYDKISGNIHLEAALKICAEQ